MATQCVTERLILKQVEIEVVTWKLHTPLNTSDISRTQVLEYSYVLKYEEHLSKTKIIVMPWAIWLNICIYFTNSGFLQ